MPQPLLIPAPDPTEALEHRAPWPWASRPRARRHAANSGRPDEILLAECELHVVEKDAR